MSEETKTQKQQEEKPDQSKTQAFRAGFMTGYTNDNPAADASVNGFFAGYVGSRPQGGQQSGQGAEDAKL